VKKAALIRGIVDSIALIPDGISRSVYVQECSRLMGMSEAVLMAELNKAVVTNFRKEKKADVPEHVPLFDELPADGLPETIADDFSLIHQEKDLIRILLNYGEKPIEITIINEDGHEEKHPVSVAEYIISNLESDEILLESPVYANIYKEYVELIAQEVFPQATNFTQHADQSISGESSAILISPYALSDNWQRHFIYPETEDLQLHFAARGSILSLKLKRIERILRDLYKELEVAVDAEKVDEIMMEIKMLDVAKEEIKKKRYG
jgi:DNA primase